MISVADLLRRLCRRWRQPHPARPALLALFVFAGLWLWGCEGREELEAWKLSGATMGTTYHITLVKPVGPAIGVIQEEVLLQVDEALDEVNQQMSTYIPDSELNALNRATVGEWIPVSRPLMEVLQVSREINRLSGGAFDITIGPLVNVWGFGPDNTQDRVPSPEAIAAAGAQVGFEHVQLRAEPPAVLKLRPVRLDLSAVAKGYGADRLAALLDGMGIANYLIEIGGELRLKGVNARGEKWRIGVESPSLMTGGVQQAIEVSDAGVATSGDYRNYFEKDGKRYSHTIDPGTGYPITHALASVTVIAETAARADALATALNVMGPRKAKALVEAEGIAAYFIIKSGEGFSESASTAFAPYLEVP